MWQLHFAIHLNSKGDSQMKLLITLLVLFTALFFNSLAYSASNDQPTSNQTNIQQLVNDTEQNENDDDSEYEDEDEEC